MKNGKLSVITDYDKLDDAFKEKVKLRYPHGLYNSIVEFTNNKRKVVRAIRFETEDKIYMLRLTKKMVLKIMEEEDELSDISTL